MFSNDLSEYVLVSLAVNLFFWLASVGLTAGIYRLPLYHPIFFYQVYHFFGFVYRPFLIWRDDSSVVWTVTGITPSAHTVLFGTLIINLALVSVITGFLIARNRNLTVSLLSPPNITVGNPKALILAVLVLVSLGFYATNLQYGGAGTKEVSTLKTRRSATGGQESTDVSGYQTAPAEFLPAVCIVLFLIPQTRRISIVLILAHILSRIYIGSGRSSFIVVILAAFFISLANARRRYPAMIAVVALLLFAIVFDVLGSDRLAFRRVLYGEASIAEVYQAYANTRGQKGLSSDTGEYDIALSCLEIVPSKTGWSYGTQYLRLLIWPIPRQLWYDKPVLTNSINLEKYGGFYGFTHTLYVDAYMVFGIPSLLLILTAVGAYLTRLYEMAGRTKNVYLYAFFWLQLAYLQLVFRDGDVSIVFFLGFAMIAAAILCRVGKLTLCDPQSS